MDGWKMLCRFFRVEEQALYMAGRSKVESSQLSGQPDAGPLALFRIINPNCAPQWVTRRLFRRPDIYLFPTCTAVKPGDMEAWELQNLRTLLSSTRGQAWARSMAMSVQ